MPAWKVGGMNQSQDRSGSTFGRYALQKVIGRGGMGEVYEAIDTTLGRTVAIKILRPEVAEDEARKARFDREAKALAALQHPGIVTIHAIESIDGVDLIAMEFVEGRLLTELIRSERPMSVDRVLELGVPIADAVAAAHRQGILHRDIKPDNIIVASDGSVKVLDFGLAKLNGPEVESVNAANMNTVIDHATMEGRILGTIDYMSPEQAQGQPTTPSTDVFSLGVVFYEMAAGASPFSGDSAISMLSSIIKDDPPGMRHLNDQVPPELERVVRRCLEKSPDRRWQTAIDVRNELEIIQRERDQVQVARNAQLSKASPAGDGNRPVQRWVWFNGGWIALALMVMVALFLFVFPEWRASDPPPPSAPPVMQPPVVQPPSGMSDSFSLQAPSGFDLYSVQISPDGRTVAMRTMEQESDSSPDREKVLSTFIHLRALDSFETIQVPDSRGSLQGRFSPSGSVFVFIVETGNQNLPLQIMRLDMTTDLPPMQIGTVSRAIFGVGYASEYPRGFTWLDEDTLLFATENPYNIVRIDARTGQEIGRTELRFEDEVVARPIRMLDFMGDDLFLMGTDIYGKEGYEQDLYWVDAVTGETGLLIPRTAIAQLAADDRIVYTRDTTLFVIDYDPIKRMVSGLERPLVSGLRTMNTWSGGNFDLSESNSLVFLPGGLQGGERTIWRYGMDGELAQLSYKERALEEMVSVSGDGRTLLVTNTNTSNAMWNLMKGTLSPPRLRPFVTLADRDIFNPVLSSDGSMAAAKTYTSIPKREVGILLFDMAKDDEFRTLMQSELEELTPLAFSDDSDALLFTRRKWDTQNAYLEVVGLEEGAVSRRLISDPAIFRNGSWSPGGDMLAYVSTESGQPEAWVGLDGDDGLSGVVPVSNEATQGVVWVSAPDGALSLNYFSDMTELSRAVSIEGGRIVLGPSRSTGRVLEYVLAGATALDGSMYVIRKGENERPAREVQMVTNVLSRSK
ncbi:MAG: hypothetical protein CMJ24_07010 [Phycisphaerae bacterium]|nr:hypothetical protein [Phycisphaerae bacterium]